MSPLFRLLLGLGVASALVAPVSRSVGLATPAARAVGPRRRVVVCVAPGKVQLKQKLSLKKADTMGGGPTDGGAGEQEKEFERHNVDDLEDPKMFNVMLLGDEGYTQEHICKAILEICEEVEIKQAEEIYLEAQKGGKANICTTSQELGEHYVQQLALQEPMIFTELKEC